MAEYKVVLFRERGVPLQVALATAAIVNRDFGPIRVEVRQAEVDIGTPHVEGFSWAHVFGALHEIARAEALPADTFVHLLMASTNAPNWFAAENPGRMRHSSATWGTSPGRRPPPPR